MKGDGRANRGVGDSRVLDGRPVSWTSTRHSQPCDQSPLFRPWRRRIPAAGERLSFRDFCHCMVGIWPTHLDLSDRSFLRTEGLQSIVDGVPLPIEELLSQPDEAGRGGDDGTLPPSAPAPVLFSARNRRATGAASRHSTGLEKSGPLCTGVVFRGMLGGDRAVRADLPFPWMDDATTSWRTLREFEGEVKGVWIDHPRLRLEYPEDVVSHVPSSAPFGMLWPGHVRHGQGASRAHAALQRDGFVSPREEAGDASGEMANSLPSSGPDPFFRAGLIAYFEITLGESMGPWAGLSGPPPRSNRVCPECVGIGLATPRFRLR